jgi:hypothetical protein
VVLRQMRAKDFSDFRLTTSLPIVLYAMQQPRWRLSVRQGKLSAVGS